MSTQKLPDLRERRELYAEVFGLGFLAVMLSLLPMLFLDKGYFIYYGDFNSQQLPFYYHANEVIRSSGLFGWDWGTDLGSSFIGSYAFYLTGSPFFWLTLLLPQDAVLYAVPWILGIKHGVAALTAYGWIRRFVKTPHAAAAGALLYACSGFQLYNIFFNHFHDVTAFFPLMLLAMEELVCHGRRGWFAASVALLACINYYFFAGQVVFLILYFLFRLKSEDFPVTWKKFAALALEAVIGVMIACAVLFPAALAVIGNSRVSQHLYGQNMLFYNDQTRILHIIQSFFMIPDIPAYPNLLTTDNAGTKWGSIGGYLPLFSMAGVITFMGQKKRHWAARLIWLCIVCAFVPVLNSIFYLFNGTFYARWYYMPILIMAMMTAYALDDRTLRWKNGLIASFIIPVLFGVISMLPTQDAEGKTVFLHFAANTGYFLIVLAVVLLCWLGSFWIYCLRSEKKPYMRLTVWLTAAACIACTSAMVWFGKCNIKDSHAYIQVAVGGRDAVRTACDADDADYFRLDMPENCDNYPMFWGMSSMRCFQSVVSPSIMEFYNSIGIPRDVSSRAPLDRYALRGLFSVKYCLQEAVTNAEPLKLPGFVYDRTENGFNIYRNDYFIPMGFTYDSYVTDEMLDGMTDQIRERILIRALVLTQEQADQYADILHETTALSVGKEEYLAACRKHAAECCAHFTYDAAGFSADIDLAEDKLVFFSIPYDEGWTAYVNDIPVQIENVDHGFMAVRCGAGSDHITFRYTLPGLRYGVIVTGAGLLLLLLYLALGKGLVREGRVMPEHGKADRTGTAVRAADAYVRAWQAEMQYQKGEQKHGTSERDQTER
jgi:uncharacterized membrane protein YfhO